ncbi:MAG: lamin tail domain-containing protein, partial [Oscillochloridaceae bacterium umkhey_bin13]
MVQYLYAHQEATMVGLRQAVTFLFILTGCVTLMTSPAFACTLHQPWIAFTCAATTDAPNQPVAAFSRQLPQPGVETLAALAPMDPLAHPSGILINEFLAAPSSGGEWAELINLGSEAVDLSGWRIDDDLPANSVRTFLPPGLILAPGTLYVIEWSASMLNNGGDTIQLIAPGELVVDAYSYGTAKTDESFARQPDGGPSWSSGPPTKGSWNNPAFQMTPSATASATASATPSATASATASATPSATASATASATPSATASATASATPSAT